MEESKYAKYVITDLEKAPKFPQEVVAEMEKWNHLILWVDDNVVSGANQMNCCWFTGVPEKQPYEKHKHDVGEIIGLFGGDHTNPSDMGGEVEFWMEDEMFTIDKSCMIYVPPNVNHCPLIIKRVDRPIFHFTVVTSPTYSMK